MEAMASSLKANKKAGKKGSGEDAVEGFGEAAEEPEPAFEDPDEPMPVQLRCVLQIVNDDDEQDLTFTAALQSHFAVRYRKFAEVVGLLGKSLLQADGVRSRPLVNIESRHSITFGEERLDRVYVDAARDGEDQIVFHPGNYRYRIEVLNRGGFRDLGLFSPASLGPEDATQQHYVCLPSAAVTRKVTLEPGIVWQGEMVVRIREQEHLYSREAADFEHLDPLRPSAADREFGATSFDGEE